MGHTVCGQLHCACTDRHISVDEQQIEQSPLTDDKFSRLKGRVLPGG
jgi:hypothetical protein